MANGRIDVGHSYILFYSKCFYEECFECTVVMINGTGGSHRAMRIKEVVVDKQ